MKVYAEDKQTELTSYDPRFGRILNDKRIVHHDYQPYIEKVFHYETLREYPNGSRDVMEVVDVEGQEEHEAYDEEEDILVYIPYTEEELRERKANEIRLRRESECFSIINRGSLWYEKLTEEQKTELSAWYDAWLDAPQTMMIPERPSWLD